MCKLMTAVYNEVTFSHQGSTIPKTLISGQKKIYVLTQKQILIENMINKQKTNM